MANIDGLKRSLKTRPKTFRYRDFVRIISKLGYEEISAGKTGGSRRRFFKKSSNDVILMDEPHDGIMKAGMVKRLVIHLEERDLL